MIGALRRRRERKAWEGRVRRQVDGLLVEEQAHLELPVAGLPDQRDELLGLYRRLLEPLGYRMEHLVKNDDAWMAHFEKRTTNGQAPDERRAT